MVLTNENLKLIIEVLLKIGANCKKCNNDESLLIQNKLNFKQLKPLIKKAMKTFESEPTLLQLKAPVRILGDIHGQFGDLIRIFELNGCPSQTSYLFLGDYVDRGKYSVETLLLLLAYKVQFPTNLFLLRGNHEDPKLNKKYGFRNECLRKYSNEMFQMFAYTFSMMPLAAVVGEKAFCCHGGLSPDLNVLSQIQAIERPIKLTYKQTLSYGLMWADPCEQTIRFRANTARKQSYYFGRLALEEFLTENNLDMIVRAHECKESGFEKIWDGKCITVFSAPQYMYQENEGAIMCLGVDMSVTFEVYKGIEN